MTQANFVSPQVTPYQLSEGWQGHLELDFVMQAQKTRLHRSQTQSPLKFQRPFYPEGVGICHGVMLHTAGGIVGGDRLSFNINLGEASHVFLTTAAATKVYRSTGVDAIQTTHISIAENACLEWFPQETILFNGAQYNQCLQVNLAENALWMGWELTRLGRSARGEKYATGQWRSNTEVWRGSNPLWIDRQRIIGGEPMLQNWYGLFGYPVVGSFVLVGCVISPETIMQIRMAWSNYTKDHYTKGQSHPMNIEITRLSEGLLCRYRGASTSEGRYFFMLAWDVLRPVILKCSPQRPRVWSI